MSGQVIFAMTTAQSAVLQKLLEGNRSFTDAERIAFYALARRGLTRGSPEIDTNPPRLTAGGYYAAHLAKALELPVADVPAGTYGPNGIERRQGDRRRAVTPGSAAAAWSGLERRPEREAEQLEPQAITAK